MLRSPFAARAMTIPASARPAAQQIAMMTTLVQPIFAIRRMAAKTYRSQGAAAAKQTHNATMAIRVHRTPATRTGHVYMHH